MAKIDFNKVRQKTPVLQEQNKSTGEVKPLYKKTSTKLPSQIIKVLKMVAIKLNLDQKDLIETEFKKILTQQIEVIKFNSLDFRELETYHFQIRNDIKIDIDLFNLERGLNMQDILYSIYSNIKR